MLVVLDAEYDPEICRYFSQRGNGIQGKLTGMVSRKMLVDFISRPCDKCGKQVRVVTEPLGRWSSGGREAYIANMARESSTSMGTVEDN